MTPALATTPMQTISVDVHDAELSDVLSLLASESGTNILVDASVKSQRVTLRLANVTLDQALHVLMDSQNLAAHKVGSVVIVGSAETMNRRYALGAASELRTVAFSLNHSDVADVVKELEAMLPADAIIVGDKRARKVVISADAAVISRARDLVAVLDAQGDADGLEGAHVHRLRFAAASDVASSLKAIAPEGSFVADEAQNAIIVNGNADVQKTVDTFVRGLDAPAPQVLFEVRVADIQPVNEQSDIGIQLGGYDLTGQPVAGAATYAFAKNSLAINARLNALVSTGHAQILATPKLLTLNNHEADLLIGETYPVVYYDARVGGQQVEFVDIGVKLRLKPTIGIDGSVTAEMHPEYSAIESFVGGYPVITNRKVDSTLRVGNNETIVLGGLIRDIDSETITRVPGLSNIPIFGKLFQDRQRSHQRDEVIFLITPHVLAPSVH